MIDELIAVDPINGQAAKTFYERTIDLGAHPNVYGMYTSITVNSASSKDKIVHSVFQVGKDNIYFRLALKTSAQVGVCCLKIYERIFRERFRIVGLDERIEKLSADL